MRSIESDIKIPRVSVPAGFFEEVERVIDFCHGCVKGLVVECFGHLPRFPVEAEGVVSSEKVAGTAEMPEIALEAEIGRLLLKVSFSGHGGEVAGVAKHLG